MTAYRTVRATPPPAPVRDAIKSGKFDAVVFTSSSTVRNLVGIAGKPHAATVIAAIGPATAKTAEEHGLRVDVLAPNPSVEELVRGAGRLRRRPPRCRCSSPASRSPSPRSAVRRAAARPGRSSGRAAGRPAAPAASYAGAARTWSPRPAWPRASWCCRSSSVRAPPSRCRSAACRASCSTPATRCSEAAAEAAEAGLGGIMLFGVPATKDAEGSGAVDPDGILNVAIADVAAEVGDALPVMADLCLDEFTDHGHCGVLTAGGSGRQRRHPRGVRRDGARPGRRRRRRRRAQRHDGRPGRGDPRRARRRRAHRRGDPGLLGEVRLRLLRPVPRGRRLLAAAATAGPTSRTAATGSRASARRSSTWPRAPTW